MVQKIYGPMVNRKGKGNNEIWENKKLNAGINFGICILSIFTIYGLCQPETEKRKYLRKNFPSPQTALISQQNFQPN